jgi:hypothetical protein
MRPCARAAGTVTPTAPPSMTLNQAAMAFVE